MKRIFLMILIIFVLICTGCSKDNRGPQQEDKTENNPYSFLITPSQAIQGYQQEVKNKKLLLPLVPEGKRLSVIDAYPAENYHPSPEFRLEEPYFYIVNFNFKKFGTDGTRTHTPITA